MNKTYCKNIISLDRNDRVYVIGIDVDNPDPTVGSIVQLVITDVNERGLYRCMFKPDKEVNWEALSEYDITPKDLDNKPELSQERSKIQTILNDCFALIDFDTEYIIGFLKKAGLELPNCFYYADILEDFAEVYGVYEPIKRSWSKRTFTELCGIYHYKCDKESCENVRSTIKLARKASELLNEQLRSLRKTQLQVYKE